MAAAVRSLIVALLMGLCGSAFAAFPATVLEGWQVFRSGGTWYGTATGMADACVKAGGTWAGPPNYCMPGYVVPAENNAYDQLSCPANSTVISGSCTCTSPYVQNGTNNGCIAPPTEQELLCAGLSGTETYASAPGNIAPGASSCNASGCMTTFANTIIRVKSPEGQYVTEGAATFTGATCTYSESSGNTQDTCPGGSQGEVNGVTVCVPYDPSSNTIESVNGSDSTETDGTDTTTTTSTSSTTCTNGSCTTTTNTTTNVNGTPTTKTTTTNEPQSEFCTKNPKAPQCSTSGSFTGSCNASFACTGDAVLCATAKAANEQLCKLKDVFEMDAETSALAQAVINGTYVTHPKDAPVVNELGLFDETNPFNAACPGDVAFSVAGVSTSIPLSQFCTQLQMMGNLLVAFTLLSATMFVIRGVS